MAAISHVFDTAVATNSIDLSTSGLQSGDYIILFSWRNSTTIPSALTGYTTIATGSGNTQAYRLHYRVATGTETTTGTESGTVAMYLGIYRNVTGLGNNVNNTAAASTTLTIPSFALSSGAGGSWVVQIGVDRNTTSQGNFATYTTRNVLNMGSFGFGLLGDTNGGVTSYSGDTSANGQSTTYAYGAIELLGSGGSTPTAHNLTLLGVGS